MLNFVRLFFFFLLAFSSFYSYSATLTWYGNQGREIDPLSECFSNNGKHSGLSNYTWTGAHLADLQPRVPSGYTIQCKGRMLFPDGSYASALTNIGAPYHSTYACTEPQFLDIETMQCVSPEPEPEPEPEKCEAGETISAKKFIASGYVPGWPPTIAFEGCELKHKGIENCVFPYSKTLEDGSVVIGSMCDVVYEYSGEKLDQGGSMDLPDKPEDDTDATKDNTKDCNRFTNADGSWGYDCNPRPDPENNSCPPGYTIQGTTCFRIPPGHPDYDESKDPQKPGNNGGSGNNSGGNNGDSGDKTNDSDAAKDSTLKQIDKSIKDVDASVKSGTSTLAGILESIKSAIQGIPGGGSGSGNGSGEGEGEGGEGSVQECPEETCQFGERDPFDGEEVPTYQESLEKIFDGLKNSPIGQSLTSISFPSGGSCPTANLSIEVMKQNIPINFSAHCDLWEHIAPFLRAAFLAFWALLAIRVFLSA